MGVVHVTTETVEKPPYESKCLHNYVIPHLFFLCIKKVLTCA
jgi:hypothetical protein